MSDLKWQYSKFTNNREGQFVLRSDDLNEIRSMITELPSLMRLAEGPTVTVTVPSTTVSTAAVSTLPKEEQEEINDVLKEEREPVEDVQICEIHNVAMKSREGKYGTFYSHSEKTDDGWRNCNGKGWR